MTDAVETTEEVETDEVETEETEQIEEPTDDPAAGLKKALAAERKARREAERKAREASDALSLKDKPADEQALEQARREAREEVLSAANARLVRSELKAELAGKVANPALALRLIDASEIEVSADGDVDADSVSAAIEALLAEAPELAAKPARFQGGADQGAKGKDASPSQLTQSDLKNLTPEQIEQARRSGRLNRVLGIN